MFVYVYNIDTLIDIYFTLVGNHGQYSWHDRQYAVMWISDRLSKIYTIQTEVTHITTTPTPTQRFSPGSVDRLLSKHFNLHGLTELNTLNSPHAMLRYIPASGKLFIMLQGEKRECINTYTSSTQLSFY